MAAGLGFKTFTSGEVLTAADTNGYLMQGVMVFANASARSAAITSPQEGQYSYLKDTNSTEYYDGAAWVAGVEGDISGVTAGVGISGGGTSGTVTVTNSMATAITTKGDLVPGTGSGTFSRLAAGSNGETLVADASTSTGLRWNPTSTMANPVINGGVDIWQRGTSFTGSNTYIYTADRWAWRDSSGGNGSLLQVTSSLPDGFQYGIKLGRASGGTSTSAQILSLPLETSNSIPYANQTITMSFYAKKGANFSPTQLSVLLYSGTGTNQSVGGTTGGAASWTGASAIISQNITAATLTTSWVRYSYSVTVGSTATQLAPYLQIAGVGTAGADDYIYLTGVQIDLGSVALPFRRSGGTIQGELACAQRYYYRHATGTSLKSIALGAYVSGSQFEVVLKLPVSMRTTPTIDQVTGTDYYINDGNSDAYNSLTIDYATENSVAMYNNAQVSGTTGQCFSTKLNNAAAYLGFNSEL